MRQYRVELCYSGYTVCEVEAENEQDAVDKAEQAEPVQVSDWMRWREGDMVSVVEP
jgi:hypothetical protein